MCNMISTLAKWFLNHFSLLLSFSMFLAFLALSLTRFIYFFEFKLFKKFVSFMTEGNWYSEKSGEVVKSEVSGDNKTALGGQEIVNDPGNISDTSSLKDSVPLKTGDIGSLKDMIKESINEGIKEALKDIIVKETKKKKEKVVKTEVPKKSKKTSTKNDEVTVYVSGVVMEDGNIVKKKKGSSKKEDSKKEDTIKEETPKG
uniref:M-ORF2 n=1 Tax=Sinanodonta woodiana TaxID=1069815 RepID=A0A346HGW7_SINWO|nr:m-ORF2 [Sinanodonta woodiana]AXO78653.1 m-ORF2 [Sinanodonta woodiana]